MNRRLLFGTALVGLLAVTAGCTSLTGSSEISQEQLAADVPYDWNTSADVTINVTGEEYHALTRVTNGSTVDVYRHETLGGRRPVDVRGVRFRYPNGTVVGPERVGVEKRDSKTVITPPAENGTLAYAAPAGRKSVTLPVAREGASYEVILPPGMRVGSFPLSRVRPGGYGTEMTDGRVHVRWTEVTADTIVVRYYLARDLTIFAGLIAGLSLVALGGVGYFYLQIRRLEREREEMGLNVDVSDDDFGGGGPPGFG